MNQTKKHANILSAAWPEVHSSYGIIQKMQLPGGPVRQPGAPENIRGTRNCLQMKIRSLREFSARAHLLHDKA
jgi:hypothetical protein